MPVPTTYINEDLSYYPFTLSQSIGSLKVGAYTMKQRWVKLMQLCNNTEVCIPVNTIPTTVLLKHVYKHRTIPINYAKQCIPLHSSLCFIHNIAAIIAVDVALLTPSTKKLPNTLHHTGTGLLHIGKGCTIEHIYCNTTLGPIYIGNHVHIQDNVCLRGPLYIGDNTVIKAGATIYGATIISNNCIIGGEVKNSIILQGTNKAHYGYLGNSMLGEYCNLGAGTTNSNIKNNASNVHVELNELLINAGIKCGTIMGHYSRTAINTSINTGTVIGTCCNIYATGLTPKYIPSFSWGVSGTIYHYNKAIADTEKWLAMKGKKLSQIQKKKLKEVYLALPNTSKPLPLT